MIEIIAEIGVNHNGDYGMAESLIDNAHYAGVDTVKFQLFHGDRYPKLQLKPEQLSDLRQYALALGLRFLCTPDDAYDAKHIKMMGCDRIKIGSSNITNLPLLRYVSTLGMSVILSTGACEMFEVDRAISALACSLEPGAILPGVIMHCVSAYPSPIRELNLRMIDGLHTRYHFMEVGYSDHTVGENYQSALIALGIGARVFEKHFTFGHWAKGPDHKISADMHQMKNYVGMLRGAAAQLGDGLKRIAPCEQENRVEYVKFVEAQGAYGSAV